MLRAVLNISGSGTRRVNVWNLRHVQYRERDKGGGWGWGWGCGGGGGLESGSCSVCSLYFSVILCASAWASTCTWKRGCANLRACVRTNHCVCMAGARVISHAAVNNIIQLLLFPQDMDVYCTHRHKDTTHGKLYKFLLSFLHIYYWYTSNHIPCSPALQHRRVIQFPFLYYCYYWDIKNALQVHYKSSDGFPLKNNLISILTSKWQGCI